MKRMDQGMRLADSWQAQSAIRHNLSLGACRFPCKETVKLAVKTEELRALALSAS